MGEDGAQVEQGPSFLFSKVRQNRPAKTHGAKEVCRKIFQHPVIPYEAASVSKIVLQYRTSTGLTYPTSSRKPASM